MKPIKRATPSSITLAGLLLTSTSFSAIIGTAPAMAQEAASPAAESGAAGDIIVTARKRGEDILKTPIAVSALTGEDIGKRGIVSVNDLATSTPGINISNISSGRSDRSFQQISLRGFNPSIATSTLVATFIDGVPVASATALNSITDPARIEILKGPQSAYFGRNTFAGAINVVNKLPGNDLSGTVSATVGTRANFDVSGSLEGALVPDKLTLRITGHAFSKDGSYTNAANGNQRLGSQRTESGTALIVAKPTERLTIKAFGLLSEDHDGPSAQGMLSAYEIRSNNGALNIPANSKSTAGNIIVAGLSNCNLTGFKAGLSATEAIVVRPFICGAAPGLPATSPAQNTLENSLVKNFLADGSFRAISPSQGVKGYGLKRRYYHLHLNVDYELGDTGITLSSLTGYNNEYYSELADLDNYDSSSLTNSAYATKQGTVLPYWDFPFLVERHTRDFSQEVRAAYDNNGPFRAVIGASYLWTRSDSDLVSGNTAFVGGAARPSSSLSAPQESRTKSAFFGLTYDITSQFKVSAEGRYEEDTIYAFTGGAGATIGAAAAAKYGIPAGTFAPLTSFFSKPYKNFLPRVIAQFDIDRNTMVYASYSKGVNVSLASFNTNFLNQSPTVVAAADGIGLGVVVNPEKLTNYEIGLKGKFLDGKLRASLAGYYAIWNSQLNNRTATVLDVPAGYQTGDPIVAPYTGVAQNVMGVANSGKVIVKGIEFEVDATPVEGLSINLAAALNDSNIRAFVDPATSKLSGVIGSGFVGNQSPGTSKYSGNLGVQYGTSIRGWDDGAWFIRSDVSYKSRIYADAANLTWIKSRTQVNFRAGISKGQVALEAFVNNAFNNRRYVSISNNVILTPDFSLAATNSYLNVGLPELRTFGIKAGYKF